MAVTRDFATLARTTRRISGTLDPDEVVRAVLEAVQIIIPGAAGRVWARGERGTARTLMGSIGLRRGNDPVPVAPGTGLAAQVEATGRAAVSEDLIADPRYVRKDWARSEGLVSCALLPLIGRDGEVFGRLSIFTRERHVFDEEQVDLLQAFANQAAISISNARLYDQSRRLAARLQALARISASVVDSLGLEATLADITREATILLDLGGAGLRLLEDGMLVLRSTYGIAPSLMVRPRLAIGESLSGHVARQGEPLAVPDLTASALLTPENRAMAGEQQVHAFMGAPVRYEGRLVGVLAAFGNHVRHFQDDDVSVFCTYADLAAIAIENARLYEAARREIDLRAASEAELVKHRDRLEELVAERTADLEAAQASLVRAERLAALGQLTGSVSHELRNPLGTVRNALALVRRLQDAPDARLERALAMAERGVTRCDAIIGEFLDFSRIQDLDRRHTAIDPWVAEILDEQPPPQGVRVERDLATEARIPIDRERLRRALRNVLDNAFEAITGSGGSGGRVRVATRIEHGDLQIHVIDDGPGMDGEVATQLFEPLFSTKPFGVGLGMAIVRQVLERHGGRVDVDSAPGTGCTITLVVPAPVAVCGQEEPAATAPREQ